VCTFFVSIKSRCSQAKGLNTIPRLGYQVTDLNACNDGTRVRCLAIAGSMVRTWSVLLDRSLYHSFLACQNKLGPIGSKLIIVRQLLGRMEDIPENSAKHHATSLC
jgi:hypothetical protein